jgi:hypothetical protein
MIHEINTNTQDKYIKIKTKIFIALIVLLVVAMVSFIMAESPGQEGYYIYIMLQYTAMLGIMLVSIFVKKRWDIEIPIVLDASFVVVGFCAFILGDVMDLYGSFYYWDDFVHFSSGVVLALAGYFIVDVAVKHERISVNLSPIFISIAIVLFTVSLAAFWEMGEYMYDDIFGTNTQQFMKSTTASLVDNKDVALKGHEALQDTMHDLMLDFGGALIVSIGVYNYEKTNKNDKGEEGVSK